MFDVQRLANRSAWLVLLLAIAGCSDRSPREVRETKKLSFDDVAAQIEAENEVSHLEE